MPFEPWERIRVADATISPGCLDDLEVYHASDNWPPYAKHAGMRGFVALHVLAPNVQLVCNAAPPVNRVRLILPQRALTVAMKRLPYAKHMGMRCFIALYTLARRISDWKVLQPQRIRPSYYLTDALNDTASM